jgi:hypothetical protein
MKLQELNLTKGPQIDHSNFESEQSWRIYTTLLQ